MPRVNLVPMEEKHRELRRRFYIVPFAGAAILLIAMGATYVYFDRQVANTETELQEFKTANANQAAQVKELEGYEAKQDEKQARLDSVIGLYSQRIRWSRILDDLAFVIPEDIWLEELEGKVPNLIVKSEKESKAGKEEKAFDFRVKGFTKNMDTIAILMVRLGLIPALDQITLVSAVKEQTKAGSLAIHFEIGANLVGTGEVQQPAVAPSTGEEGPSDTTTTNGGTTGTSTGGSTNTAGGSTNTRGGSTSTTGR